MRYFLARRPPPFTRMLVVESGSRRILEEGIPRFRAIFGDQLQMDLLTCLPGLPRVLDPSLTQVFRVTQCHNGGDRRRLLAELRSRRYPLVAMICSDEPVMTPWKLAAALVVPGKVLVFNENSDFFWVDWRHRGAIRRFLLFRAGLLEDDAARELVQLAAFPFLLAFLLLYAGYVHLRRAFRVAMRNRDSQASDSARFGR